MTSTASASKGSALPSEPLVSSAHTRALLAGAAAGTLVDVSLFPLDTLKTRLQSPRGFFPSGGFRGIYSGLGSAASGSAPSAALFFLVYDGLKTSLSSSPSFGGEVTSQILAASAGELAACAVRVPVEVVKQRAQAGQKHALRAIWRGRKNAGMLGTVGELYRGAGATVLRELPFTAIQFPIWEALKKGWGDRGEGAMASAVFGSMAGALAAGLTTPIDVIKTRVMLERQRIGIREAAVATWREGGARAFLKGIVPRTIWISLGGAVFLGGYQGVTNILAESKTFRRV